MDSPQRRRIPPQVPPPIPPLYFNPAPNPVSLFFLKLNLWLSLIYDDYKAHYTHLPVNLQQQLAALPPLRPSRGRGVPNVPVSLSFLSKL
jgi:hypothetical protein